MDKLFFSRRNRVFLRGGLVVKQVFGPESARKEAGLLRELRETGVSVPEIFEQRGDTIEMEYIPGETLPDFLARMETDPDEALLRETARRLCQWFECFYRAVDHPASGEIRGDVNGRNFIIGDARVVGVDFEERVYGARERDLGRLLAFIRTYDPAGTPVKRRFSSFLWRGTKKCLKLSTLETWKQYFMERIAMRKRRARRRR